MSAILDLSTKQQRPQIKIDDVSYDLVMPSDLELKDAIWLERAQNEIEQLTKKIEGDKVNEGIVDRLQKLISRFADMLLQDVPSDVRSRLSGIQKLGVVNAYSKELNKEKQDFFVPGGEKPPTLIGSKSSPSSKGSTAEASRAG